MVQVKAIDNRALPRHIRVFSVKAFLLQQSSYPLHKSCYVCGRTLNKVFQLPIPCKHARPHGSNAASREWSLGPNEPYWRTNTSFSPPPSRWDFQFQPEGLSFGSHDGNQLYNSSTSSNSRESRSWMRGNHISNQYSISDTVGPYFSSPSEMSPAQQWAPPTIQEIRMDDYGSSSRRVLGLLSFSPAREETSVVQDSRGSTSSRSDSSDYEPMTKSQLSSHRNFPSRRCFMSKPIHPLSFPSETPVGQAADTSATSFSELDAGVPRRESQCISSASGSIDFTDVSEQLESDSFSRLCNPSDGFKCALCERFLSQRSPWSSRRIVKSGDMPVAGVLSCRHVFHAECLEQTTPKTRKSDPPCPLCARSEEENSPEQRVFSKLKSSFPKLRPLNEDGPSRPWGCTQAGDCVEGALQAPSRNTMLLLNRNRNRKNLALKGSSGKEFPGKLRKIGSYSSPLLIGRSGEQGTAAAGSSKTTPGPGIGTK